MIAGPEQARLMEEFVTQYSPDIAEKHPSRRRFFQTKIVQTTSSITHTNY